MKKTIRFCILHKMYEKESDYTPPAFLPQCIFDTFNMVFTFQNPDYIIATEFIYEDFIYYTKFKKLQRPGVINIFFAGECISPDLNIFDYALSFDKNLQCADRIARTPSLYFYNKENEERLFTPRKDPEEILKQKRFFCNFIYSNGLGHQNRDKLFFKISEYKPVHSLGKHLNNASSPVTDSALGWEKESIEIKRPYKFSIAAENASYLGYTSEKIMTSFLADTIPIYWGDPSVATEFNPKAFINCHAYENFHEVMQAIAKIDNDDALYCQMLSEPSITQEQRKNAENEYKKIENFWYAIFSQKLSAAKRVGEGFHPSLYTQFFSGEIFTTQQGSLFKLARYLIASKLYLSKAEEYQKKYIKEKTRLMQRDSAWRKEKSITGRTRIFYKNKRVFSYPNTFFFTWNKQYKKLASKFKNNEFVHTILSKTKEIEIPNRKIVILLSSIEPWLDDINTLLYQLLPQADKEVFVQFILKNFGSITTISPEENAKVVNMFDEAQKLYESRKSIHDPIELDYKGKKIQYISSNPLKCPGTDELSKFLYGYEIVHTFMMDEYYKAGFLPEDGQTIFDIGAANGDTAVAFAVQYPHSHVYSIESSEKALAFVQANKETNALSLVHPVKAFVHNTTGELEIDGNIEKTISIDDYVAEHAINNIGLIKMDIEGAEIPALHGALQTIKRDNPCLYIPIYHLRSDIFEVPRFLHGLNIPMKFALGFADKRIWGADCVLFVKFIPGNF